MIARILQEDGDVVVSMKSGLEGRNNVAKFVHHTVTDDESQ